MIAPPPSISMLAGWPPSIAVGDRGGEVAGVERVVGDGAGQRVDRLADSTLPVTPSRLNADSAFGLA